MLCSYRNNCYFVFKLSIMMNNSIAMREKRDESLDDFCTELDYNSIKAEAIADVSMDINALPGLHETFGFATSAVSAATHVTKARMEMTKLSLGCDDIPFNEIKDIVNTKFSELNRLMDISVKAMEKVNSMISKTSHIVEKTRLEMQMGFDKVINEIKNTSIKQKITKISNFAEYFNVECARINGLKKDKYVAKLEEQNSILDLLKDSRTPKVGTLYSAMNDIITNDDAIPKNANDSTAFQALFALFYGAQTYVALFGFLIKSHSYLADYYYQHGDYEKFNQELDKLRNTFDDFQSSLVGKKSGFVMKISDTLKKVKGKSFINSVNDKLYKQIAQKSKLLTIIQNELNKMTLPLIKDTPKKPTLRFEKPDVNVPIGLWKDGAVVKYAVQYEKDGIYSKISQWSDQLNVKNKAFPSIKVNDPMPKVNRLIFRKFNNNPLELIGVLGPSKVELRDKDRDLYNAAGELDKQLGLEEAKLFVGKGANINAIFELGRTPLHNAAKFGSTEVFAYLRQYGARDANIKDRKGWTPLHVAADAGRHTAIEPIIKNLGSVTAKTTAEGYTVFHIASRKGLNTVSEALRKYASKSLVDAKDNNGFTALHMSVSNGKAFLSAVLANKPNVNAKSNTGLTPTHLAAIEGNFNYIRQMKSSNGFKINEVDMNNLTPLHYGAIMGNQIAIRNMLTLKDINVNMQGKGNKWTPLHYAIFLKKTNAAFELIKYAKTDQNAKAMNDVTPLHFAASTGQHAIIEVLLKKANIEAKTDKGETALHLAAIRGCERCVKLLVGKGANLNAKTKDNKTALELATKYHKNVVADYLKSQAGKRVRKYIAHLNPVSPNRVFHEAGLIESVASLPQLLERRDTQIAITTSLPLDANATLLLLDVLLRKLTDERYSSTLQAEYVSEIDAQLKAMAVVEQFEKFMNMMITVPVEELIDLTKVASEVKKALMSGRGNKVVDILCTFSKMVHALTPEDLENLATTFLPETATVSETTANMSDEVMSLLESTCPAE